MKFESKYEMEMEKYYNNSNQIKNKVILQEHFHDEDVDMVEGFLLFCDKVKKKESSFSNNSSISLLNYNNEPSQYDDDNDDSDDESDNNKTDIEEEEEEEQEFYQNNRKKLISPRKKKNNEKNKKLLLHVIETLKILGGKATGPEITSYIYENFENYEKPDDLRVFFLKKNF